MKTILNGWHRAMGAKMVDFAGWEMPISYVGNISEHQTVRQRAGVFDVSHMGRITFHGPDAEKYLDFLSTNHIAGRPDKSATYTVWCLPSGGCVDDVIVYKENPQSFFAIVNASNREKDLKHVQDHLGQYRVTIGDCFSTEGILSIQGPEAAEVIFRIFPEASFIKPMHFQHFPYHEQEVILSRTGYTGSGGFEIYAPHAALVDLWDRFNDLGIQPIGLAARDTLRLEMGYALYGHEINEQIAPTESVSAWTVKLDKENFLGKSALTELDHSEKKRSEYGIILQDPGIAREGYEVYLGEKMIGQVTSGTLSPTLQKSIAIIISDSPLHVGDEVQVQIRQHRAKAKVVKLPFLAVKSTV